MTIDEAIKHAEEVARQNEKEAVIYSNCKNHKKNLFEVGLVENAEKKCYKCAEEYRQLAEWLKDYKRLKEQELCEEAVSKQVVLDMLEDINAETEGVGFYYEHYVEYIKKLPPVKPQPICEEREKGECPYYAG